jgi:very-short-patch-repair endonuclease
LRLKRKTGGYYFYDFTDIKNKKIIEYNGDMYHANPNKYKAKDNPHPFRKSMTSKEIWDKDSAKIKLAQDNGYEVLVIWDSEYRYKGSNNKEKVIQKCINFLKNEYRIIN